jgi:hypothetical protein
LGCVGFEVSDLPAWERFAVEVLGLVVAERRADGVLTLRMDDQTQHIVLHPGPRDDLEYARFEVRNLDGTAPFQRGDPIGTPRPPRMTVGV